MNVWTGFGHVGSDPVLRETASGKAVLNFSIAVDREVLTIVDGEKVRQKVPDWIPITVWDEPARTNAKYLQKGSLIGVTGSLRPREYTDRSGNKHKAFEVVARRIDWISGIRSNKEISDQPEATEAPEATT